MSYTPDIVQNCETNADYEKEIHTQVGDHVRIHATGTSVFSIIESVTDAPGKYPWPTDLTTLVATGDASD